MIIIGFLFINTKCQSVIVKYNLTFSAIFPQVKTNNPKQLLHI